MLLIGVFVYSSLGLWTAHSNAQRPRSVLYRRCEFYNQTKGDRLRRFLDFPRHAPDMRVQVSPIPRTRVRTDHTEPCPPARSSRTERPAVASGVPPLFLKLAASHGNH